MATTIEPHETPRKRKSAIPAAVSFAIVGTFIILSVGALYYGRSFFLPLVLAILITFAFSPVVRTLGHRGIPPVVTAVVLVILLGIVIIGISVMLSGPLSSMISQAPNLASEVRERFAFLNQPFATLSAASRQIQSLTSGASEPGDPQRVVVVGESGLIGWLAGTVADIGTTFGAMLILSLFLLSSDTSLRAKLIRMLPDLSGKKRSLRLLHDIENEVSRYLLTITAINAGLGCCIGIAMAILGMPNPVLWGLAGGLLNFIPYLGSLIGNLLATSVAIVTFPSLGEAALVPISYLALQVVEGNFVTPFILGRRLELNIVAILVFLSLTTWMWGIVGTIIGVPILVVIKVFSDNFPQLAPLAEFLSAAQEPRAPEDVETPTTSPEATHTHLVARD